MADPTREFCERALREPDAFWAEQAALVHWQRPFQQVCDFSRAPFVRWFVGGETNLCYNALDRHLPTRAEQAAIRFISTETGETRTLSYRELHAEVNALAAALQGLGLQRGDRAVLYLPMIPEALVAMLACTRLGLVHSAVFAGFAAPSLAERIDAAGARVVLTCDAGMRGGKLVPLKKIVDEALTLTRGSLLEHVVVLNRGLDPTATRAPGGRELDWAELVAPHAGAVVPPVWLESGESSILLYTSGTTARPKGVQRDTGGWLVALAASIPHIFGGRAGETFFCTADIGWVVGHCYTVYAPLIAGMTTVVYEGLPTRPDGAIWWKIVEETGATVMFTSPTAARVLKKQDPALIRRHAMPTLRSLFIAGEPLDEPTYAWLRDSLGHVNILDNFWQTETGWPMLTYLAGHPLPQVKPGSPGFAAYGYRARVVDPETGEELARGEKGVLAVGLPLPPGCMSTVWENDEMFAKHYCGQWPGKLLYSTFDYAVQDADGYFFILGRTDDVINVAGHRLGTREIEEAVSAHPGVAEVATIGAKDELKGQAIQCFVVLKQPDQFADDAARAAVCKEIEATVVKTLGAVARPALICVVRALPKTRSGKIVRRAIQAVAEGRPPGDVSTMEDPAVLDGIRDAIAGVQPGAGTAP